MSIRLDGRNTAPVRRRIQGMRERAGNVLAAWEEVTDWFADQNRLQWGSRGGRYQQLWPELASTTLRDKAELGYPTDILRRDRTLERSLTDRPLSVELLEPHAMKAGTRVPYAKYHQYGTRHMPARTLFSVRRIAEEGAVAQAVLSWIVDGRAVIRR